ncbi:MAG: NifU family protein [Spirochaetota bacterium]|nr:NifU family protein [Spirochaetota bacterium]
MSATITDEQVLEALDEIRPNLQMDGGDIEFLGLEDNKAKVKLTGACGTCPSSIYTLKMGVEAHLKDRIPGLEGIISE